MMCDHGRTQRIRLCGSGAVAKLLTGPRFWQAADLNPTLLALCMYYISDNSYPNSDIIVNLYLINDHELHLRYYLGISIANPTITRKKFRVI